MKTLYREDLEQGIARGCQAPGCKHDHGMAGELNATPITTTYA